MTRTYARDALLDAIIARDICYGQTRWTDVWLSIVMALFGIIMLVPVLTFSGPQWRVIARYMSEDQAGTIAIVAGSLWLVTL